MVHQSTRRALRMRIVPLLAALSLLVTPGAAQAAERTAPAIEIGTVDGQSVRKGRVATPLSGEVTVTGTASPSSAAADEQQALVADAGDSPFVARGDRAILLGSAYGGTAPYAFAWSTRDGELIGPHSASTELDTTGLAPGIYEVSLMVTDAAGPRRTR